MIRNYNSLSSGCLLDLKNRKSDNRTETLGLFQTLRSSVLLGLFMVLFLLLSGNSTYAQSFAVIGSGTTATTSTGSDPIDGYFASFRYQVVYTAAELTTAGIPAYGSISQLGFSISGDI